MTQLTPLAVIETHPVQYHAPVYRALEQDFGIKTTAIYGSDFSVVGYRDRDFDRVFKWDTDLLSGYKSIFLENVHDGGARDAGAVRAAGLDSMLTKLHPQTILLVGYSPRFYRDAILAARRQCVPLLFRGETSDGAKTRALLKQLIRDTALGWLYRRCAALLYIGRQSLRHYQRLGVDRKKLFFSPYCVDDTVFETNDSRLRELRATTCRELECNDSDITLLFSGKLVARKAPEMILKAVKALPSELRTRMTVLWLGDGEMKKEIAQLAAAEPTVASRFLGFQNQRSLSRYYAASDLLVLPSPSETWGLVVNEALHHGVPCIVSDSVGCAEDLILAGSTGEIFETGSVSSLAAALKRGITLAGQEQTRFACRSKADQYSVSQAAAGISQAFHCVISKQSRYDGQGLLVA